MFIVIDGIDGSGKWTQLALLKESLESIGKKVKVVDYPRYGNNAAFFVEKYLNGEYGKEVSPELASLFYALDRFDHSAELREDIKNHDYVISNRYVSASMIHQWGKIKDKKDLESFIDWLSHLEFDICGIPKPDKTFFLDVPPEVSKKLIAKKEQRDYIKDGSNKDIHEADDNHLKDAYESALYICTRWWTRIECTVGGEMLPQETITQMILKQIL